MAAKKKKAAPKPAKEKKKKVAPKKPKGGDSAVDEVPQAAGSVPGHNLKIPPEAEVKRMFNRVEKILEDKGKANAAFMADVKGAYSEYADKWGMSIATVRAIAAKKRAEEDFADAMAEAEPKKKEDLTRLMAACATAFGDDTPFGAWANAQADIYEVEEEEVGPAPAAIVKTNVTGLPPAGTSAAQAAQEAWDTEERNKQATVN